MGIKKKTKPANLAPATPRTKEISEGKQATDSKHKNRFEQLLDDAILGIKKK